MNKNVFNVELSKGNSIVSVNRSGYNPIFACLYLTPDLVMGAKYNQNTQEFSDFFGYTKFEIKDISIKTSIFMNKIYITLNEKDEDLKVGLQFENSFEYSFDEKYSINRDLVIDLRPKPEGLIHSGGSDTNINFIGFLLFMFMKSDFSLMLFEKPFFSENDNKIIPSIIEQISLRLNEDKQIIAMFHPEDELVKDLPRIDDVNIFTPHDYFFIKPRTKE